MDVEWTSPQAAGLSPARLSRLTDAIQREIDRGRLPGAVAAIGRRGAVAWTMCLGRRDPARPDPMRLDALFRLYSMTKPIVSLGVMMLLEEGRLMLADPIAKYLPELGAVQVGVETPDGFRLEPLARPITVQDLLRHTSGLTYRERGPTPAHKLYPGSSISAAVKMSRAEYLAAMAKAPLLFEPGSDWEYGFSTDVLGLLVEAVTGEPLGKTLEKRIWQPLGMSSTAFDLTPALASRYALALPKDPMTGAAQVIHHATNARTQWESGGGGGLSTALDYLKFAEALRRGGKLGEAHILGRKTVELMTADHLPESIENRIADSMDPSSAGYGFGLGVAVRRQAGIAALAGSKGDWYWSGVYGTYFWVDPAEQLSIVWMCASPGLMRLRYRPMVRALVYQAVDD